MNWRLKLLGGDYEDKRRKHRILEAIGAIGVVAFFCLQFVALFFALKFTAVTVIPIVGFQTTFSSGWLVGVSTTSLTVTIWTTFQLSDALERRKYRYLAD